MSRVIIVRLIMRVFLDDVFFFASLLLKKRPQMITLLLNSQQIYKILHTYAMYLGTLPYYIVPGTLLLLICTTSIY